MGPEMHLIRRCLIAGAACLTLASAVAPAESRAQLTEMGHRAIATDGPRPLLTLMGDFSDQRFDVGHDAPFYADLLFANGRGAPASLDGYFRENSNGVFNFFPAPIPSTVPAGYRAGRHPRPVHGSRTTPPRRSTSRPTPTGAPTRQALPRADRAFATRCNVLMRAVQAGFPFRNFDDNSDGCVTNDELTIMIVFAEPSRSAGGMPTGGQAASVGPLPLPGSPSVSLCPIRRERRRSGAGLDRRPGPDVHARRRGQLRVELPQLPLHGDVVRARRRGLPPDRPHRPVREDEARVGAADADHHHHGHVREAASRRSLLARPATVARLRHP